MYRDGDRMRVPSGVISNGFLITIRLLVGVMKCADLALDFGVVVAEVILLFFRGVVGTASSSPSLLGIYCPSLSSDFT